MPQLLLQGGKTAGSKQDQATAPSIHPQPSQAQGNRKAPKGAIPNCSKSSGLWQLGFVQQPAKACAHPQRWARGGITPCPGTEGSAGTRDLNHGQGGNCVQGKAAQGGEESAGTLEKGG